MAYDQDPSFWFTWQAILSLIIILFGGLILFYLHNGWQRLYFIAMSFVAGIALWIVLGDHHDPRHLMDSFVYLVAARIGVDGLTILIKWYRERAAK